MMKMVRLAGSPSGGDVHDAGRRPVWWLMPALMAAALLMALSISVAATKQADAAATSGKAFGWGDNSDGQLGNGTTDDRNTPGAVSNLTGVKSVTAGCYHGLALLKDGTVRAWGDNGSGELGDGTTDDSDVPVRVSNLTDVKAISAGCEYSLALKENGSVWAWGDNYYGELGNGTTIDSNVPVRVGSLGTGAKGIAAGYYVSLALMKNGTVESWGYNGYGVLGNGTNNDSNVPVSVSNLSGVKAISMDSYTQHALALLNNGTVRAWGGNDYGQLGDGTNDDSNVPVSVSNLSNVRSVSGGAYQSLAILENGKARSWGDNSEGELGDGTTTDRNTPGAVSNLTNVRSMDGGYYFTLASKN